MERTRGGQKHLFGRHSLGLLVQTQRLADMWNTRRMLALAQRADGQQHMGLRPRQCGGVGCQKCLQALPGLTPAGRVHVLERSVDLRLLRQARGPGLQAQAHQRTPRKPPPAHQKSFSNATVADQGSFCRTVSRCSLP